MTQGNEEGLNGKYMQEGVKQQLTTTIIHVLIAASNILITSHVHVTIHNVISTKEKDGAKLGFPDGWEVQTKKPSLGALTVWNHTIFLFHLKLRKKTTCLFVDNLHDTWINTLSDLILPAAFIATQ